jgi:ATP-dependent helicase HrpB
VGASDLLLRAERIGELERSGFSTAVKDALGIDVGAVKNVLHVRTRLLETARRILAREAPRRAKDAEAREEALLRAVLAGFPDRVARRREEGGDRLVLASGGGAKLSPGSVVKDAGLLVAVDVDATERFPGTGQGEGALVRMASRIERKWLDDTPGLSEALVARFNRSREAVECVKEVRYHALLLEERPAPGARDEDIVAVLRAAAAEDLDRALPLTEAVTELCDRIAFLRRPRRVAAPPSVNGPRRTRPDRLGLGMASGFEVC